MGFAIGSALDSIMTKVRQAQAAAAAKSVKEPLPDAPDAKKVNPAEGRYLDSFEPDRARQMGLATVINPVPGLIKPITVMPQNEAKDAQKEEGWNNAQPTVAQTSKKGCAEASLTYLEQSGAEAEQPLSQEQALEKVRNKADTVSSSEAASVDDRLKVNLDDGATPQEMGVMLGSMGLSVTHASSELDTAQLTRSLKNGQMAVAQVDSNALLSATLAKGDKLPEGEGQLHWLTIDGVDSRKTDNPDDDLYHVRDPINGAYWVTADALKKATAAAQEQHGSGGVMTIKKDRHAQSPEQRQELSRENFERSIALGKGNGGASRRLSLGESSD